MFSERTRFALQKDPFWTAKGLLLNSKRTPFEQQKDPFCNPKGLLLKNEGFASENQLRNIDGLARQNTLRIKAMHAE